MESTKVLAIKLFKLHVNNKLLKVEISLASLSHKCGIISKIGFLVLQHLRYMIICSILCMKIEEENAETDECYEG